MFVIQCQLCGDRFKTSDDVIDHYNLIHKAATGNRGNYSKGLSEWCEIGKHYTKTYIDFKHGMIRCNEDHIIRVITRR